MKAKILTFALALGFLPAVSSATTTTPIGTNQYFISYDHLDSDVNLRFLNLDSGPIAISAMFAEQDTSGSLKFSAFSFPPADGAGGSISVILTNENNVTGSDDETIAAFFNGSPLTFTEVAGVSVASFSVLFSGIIDPTLFELRFTGFDPGDQFHLNVANMAAVPLPPSLLLLITALVGPGLMLTRREQTI